MLTEFVALVVIAVAIARSAYNAGRMRGYGEANNTRSDRYDRSNGNRNNNRYNRNNTRYDRDNRNNTRYYRTAGDPNKSFVLRKDGKDVY